MKLIEHGDARAFSGVAGKFYMQREAEHCVELGILHGLLHRPQRSVRGNALGSPRLWAVHDDRGEVVATMVQSVADRTLVSRGPDNAIELIARRFVEAGCPARQLIGPAPGIEAFAKRVSELSGRAVRREMSLRVFELRAVQLPARQADGAMRLANSGDRETLAHWTLAFLRDVGERADEAEGLRMADGLLDDGRSWLWCDAGGQPCATAATFGQTPNGIRISLVYTPPDRRGRGYASHLVAGLSQRMLDSGRKFCFLFTDLANPTSNRIYQQIGYQRVADCERWAMQNATSDER